MARAARPRSPRAALAIAALAPFALGLASAACASGVAGDLSGVPDKRECEVALALPNMVCEEGCPIRVRSALSNVAGVRGVDVDYTSKDALVDAEYPACSRAGVEQMINELFQKGYVAHYVDMRSINRMQ